MQTSRSRNISEVQVIQLSDGVGSVKSCKHFNKFEFYTAMLMSWNELEDMTGRYEIHYEENGKRNLIRDIEVFCAV